MYPIFLFSYKRYNGTIILLPITIEIVINITYINNYFTLLSRMSHLIDQ